MGGRRDHRLERLLALAMRISLAFLVGALLGIAAPFAGAVAAVRIHEWNLARNR